MTHSSTKCLLKSVSKVHCNEDEGRLGLRRRREGETSDLGHDEGETEDRSTEEECGEEPEAEGVSARGQGCCSQDHLPHLQGAISKPESAGGPLWIKTPKRETSW